MKWPFRCTKVLLQTLVKLFDEFKFMAQSYLGEKRIKWHTTRLFSKELAQLSSLACSILGEKGRNSGQDGLVRAFESVVPGI